jgi:tRNA A-37 threonylcarbamoyl transferase component Bud32
MNERVMSDEYSVELVLNDLAELCRSIEELGFDVQELKCSIVVFRSDPERFFRALKEYYDEKDVKKRFQQIAWYLKCLEIGGRVAEKKLNDASLQ